MTRLFLVRHGPTHARGMVGWTDLPADLSDSAALARLSAHLPRGAAVVSSDLTRAVTTADAIQDGRTRLPHEEDLREFHFGEWEMKTAREIGDTHPELSRAYWTDPGPVRPPGGESWNDAKARVDRVIDRLAADHSDLIVVAHFGVILTQLQRALGGAASEVLAHRIDTLSVTEVEIGADGWRSAAINHLP